MNTDGGGVGHLEIVGQPHEVAEGRWWFDVLQNGRRTLLINITQAALLRLKGRYDDLEILNSPESPDLISRMGDTILPIVARMLAAGRYSETGLLIEESDVTEGELQADHAPSPISVIDRARPV